MRRTSGRLAFNWYRIKVRIPERIGRIDPTGSTVVFEVVVDDYAEVWVDGRLARRLGQTGGSLIGGFNAPNRVVLTRDARPGQQIQIAVFGINGPLSDPPANFIWVRSATLDFHKPGSPAAAAGAQVVRLDPVDGGETAAQDMVAAPERAGLLDAQDIHRPFHDADHAPLPSRVRAEDGAATGGVLWRAGQFNDRRPPAAVGSPRIRRSRSARSRSRRDDAAATRSRAIAGCR